MKIVAAGISMVVLHCSDLVALHSRSYFFVVFQNLHFFCTFWKSDSLVWPLKVVFRVKSEIWRVQNIGEKRIFCFKF